MCSGHGDCGHENSCTCWNDWFGGDCSLRSCPSGPAWADIAIAADNAHNLAECSNRGNCDRRTGQCKCMDGYEGIACNRMRCPNACSSHGSCGSMTFTASREDPGVGQPLTYSTRWDSNMIYGCTCDDGWEGYDCSLQQCPTGDDVLTTGQVNAIMYFKCPTLTSGGFYLQYDQVTSVFIPYNANVLAVQAALAGISSLGPLSVTFVGDTTGFVSVIGTPTSSPGNKVCGDTLTAVRVEFLQQFGEPQHLLALNSLGNTEPKVLFGYSETDVNIVVGNTIFHPVTGTKENAPCSNRGFCDQSMGVCKCYTGFVTSNGNLAPGTRGDCGWAEDAIQYCPGEIECSGHGVCSGSPMYSCSCDVGWMSGDCSLRVCPVGLDWFGLPEATESAHTTLVECSNKGLCDRTTGECECQSMFEGKACERMTCPGRDTPCSGHGICTTMSGLAEFNEVNGVLTPQSYGHIPNNPKTWDYNMVYGCACDDGWEGYDCSLRNCPYGDDSTTYYTIASRNSATQIAKRPEVQTFRCDAAVSPVSASPGIYIAFRNYKTSLISTTAVAADLVAALEALPSIEKVKVTTTPPNSAICTPLAVVAITFYSPSGSLPLGVITLSNPGDFTASASIETSKLVDGNTDDEECVGRGICNRELGTCKCFIGYGSSDGAGNKGGRNDCGYRVAYDPSSEAEPARWDKRLRGEFRAWETRGRQQEREFSRDTELDAYRDRGWGRRDGLRNWREEFGLEE